MAEKQTPESVNKNCENTEDIFPSLRLRLEYVCVECGASYPDSELLYACPKCGGVLLLENRHFDELKKTSALEWRQIFDNRQRTHIPALKGIFRFYELIAPVFEEKDIIWLGEGNTPIVDAAERFSKELGLRFAYKNDGQNPSASFKDRGMACAFSYLRWLAKEKNLDEILAICASTGDTSAAAALYAAYSGPPVKSVVLLPKGKVTPQQLSQPLGSGAIVLEIPGVFDDCMKIVEKLAEDYTVALLNSKNSWRILGQESYAYETAQWLSWNTENLCLFVPVGNAGNISAIMSGFLKLHRLKIISTLPRIFGVQSNHANPVYKYYSKCKKERAWQPVKVRPSVAQAAMIGNPVSFPRVRFLAEKYMEIAGENAFNVIETSEQEIMEAMLYANRHGHIACTQGGECLAGMIKAIRQKKICKNEYAILDSTAHSLKFAGFQEKYFNDNFEDEYEIKTDKKYMNMPYDVMANPERENISDSDYAKKGAETIAALLKLKPVSKNQAEK